MAGGTPAAYKTCVGLDEPASVRLAYDRLGQSCNRDLSRLIGKMRHRAVMQRSVENGMLVKVLQTTLYRDSVM